tara:strand:- start:751 stop:942 length:192 start_codon:yes stop_codon:yes gene_type:complete
MSDEIVKAVKDAEPIKNGGTITLVFETGTAASGLPDVNSFVPSGTHFARLNTRFDEHYGGGAS